MQHLQLLAFPVRWFGLVNFRVNLTNFFFQTITSLFCFQARGF